jgi:hypothetical protein
LSRRRGLVDDGCCPAEFPTTTAVMKRAACSIQRWGCAAIIRAYYLGKMIP